MEHPAGSCDLGTAQLISEFAARGLLERIPSGADHGCWRPERCNIPPRWRLVYGVESRATGFARRRVARRTKYIPESVSRLGLPYLIHDATSKASWSCGLGQPTERTTRSPQGRGRRQHRAGFYTGWSRSIGSNWVSMCAGAHGRCCASSGSVVALYPPEPTYVFAMAGSFTQC